MENKGGKNRDRISNLPYYIIHQILSSLETKYVVQTSLLSTRWKNLWTRVPYLNLSFNPDIDCAGYMKFAYKLVHQSRHFIQFVQELLNRRGDSKLEKFKFQTNVALEIKFIHYILVHIVRANVKEVEFEARIQRPSRGVGLPECFYTCTSIEKLRLSLPGVILSQGFSSLKELNLHRLTDDDVISAEFFSNCPAMESLSFTNCRSSGLVVKVSAPKLRKLQILNSCFRRVVISSPLLAYFKLEGYDVVNLSIDDRCCLLEEVDIHVFNDYSEDAHRANQLIEMLRELASAKSVVVSLDTLGVLSKARVRIKSEAPSFPLLKSIKLKTNWSIPRDGWNYLLQNSATEVETSILVPSPMPRLTTKSFTTL